MAKRVSKKTAAKLEVVPVEVETSVSDAPVATATEAPIASKENVSVPSQADAIRNAMAKIKQPTFEEIRVRAFDIYLRRDGAAGDETSDWLEAERELYLERTKDLKGE